MSRLIQYLVSEGYLKTPRLIKAFKKIRRDDFVLPKEKESADLDMPLSIGEGQTISQPLTVAFMFEKLAPQPGQKILDVGSGSGWTTALLAEIVGKSGKVIGIERIEKLCDFGRKNVKKYKFISEGRAKIICADGTKGWKKEAPYDRILVSAAAEEIPEALKNQLAVGGRMMIPVQDSLWLVEKIAENKFHEAEYPGFVFVSLIPSK
ncbi:MAG: protein-L-isoaspartate O-methyltransferase [Candidatus Moranbacteria bacterium]|nr:protein-L-isoaspartate O-methyltransferase [Candidatus Moranbacteria bacterium]